MIQSQKTPIKKIILVLGSVLAAFILILLPVLYTRRNSCNKETCSHAEHISMHEDGCSHEESAHDECVLLVQSRPHVFEGIFIHRAGVSAVYEKENIIPIRSLKTEEKVKAPVGFLGRIKGYFFRKSEEKAEVPTVTAEEMEIQLNNTENIMWNYDKQFVKEINKMKSREKQMLILEIRSMILNLSTILPSKLSLLDDSNNLFWLTVYCSGDLLVDWMAFTFTVEELSEVKMRIEDLFNSTEEAEVLRNNLLSIVQSFITKIASKTGLGGKITKQRENVATILRDYKATQKMVCDIEESCETEKLLLVLDALSYLIPMTEESNKAILQTVNRVQERISGLAQSIALRQMNDYLSLTKKYNSEIIGAINGYMRFISDFEQYIGVNTFNTENIKNVEKMNDSTFVYDFKPTASASEVIKGSNKMISVANILFKQYMHLLSERDTETDYTLFILDENAEEPVVVAELISEEEQEAVLVEEDNE
ncbi:hypothetical protein NEAUS05_2002 [Nematocida ausubeli]|nr:hypothetical protein NEAUS05_2002 [Nematocida ausubeli]